MFQAWEGIVPNVGMANTMQGVPSGVLLMQPQWQMEVFKQHGQIGWGVAPVIAAQKYMAFH